MLDHRPITKRSQVRHTQIYTHVLIAHREFLRQIDFARECDVPLLDFLLDRDRLDLSLYRALQFDFGASYLCEVEVVAVKLPPGSIRIGEGVVAVTSLKPGEARSLTGFATSKEVLEGFIKTAQYILENMGCYILVLFPDFCFDLRQIVLLIVVVERLACRAIGVFAL